MFKTPFKDAIVKNTGMSGDGVAQTNGLDILDGKAGTKGIMPEVTLVDVPGGPSEGSTHMGAGGSLGVGTGKTSKDLTKF
jgi:hypothetical protein